MASRKLNASASAFAAQSRSHDSSDSESDDDDAPKGSVQANSPLRFTGFRRIRDPSKTQTITIRTYPGENEEDCSVSPEYLVRILRKAKISAPSPSKHVRWIDIENPGADLVMEIADILGLHPLTVDDCIHRSDASHQKVDVFESYYELSAGAQTGQFAGGDLYIIVTLNLVITLRYHPLYVITRAVKRADATPLDKIFEAGSCCDWLMYVLVDELTSGLYRIVDALEKEVDLLDELAVTGTGEEQFDFLMREKAVRNRLGVVRRQLNEKRMVIHSLSGWPEESDEFSKGKGQLHKYSELFGMNLAKEVTVYLRDVLDDIETMLEAVDTCAEDLTNAGGTYLSRVNIRASEASNELSEVMKIFGAIATVTLPYGFVSGMWGTNSGVVGEYDDAGNQLHMGWFFGLTGSSLGYAVVVGFILWRIGWL